MGNYDLAREGAQIMDALAELNHLPAVGLLCLSLRREGLVITADFYASDGHRSLGLWARAFDAPVRLLKVSPTSRIKTRLVLAEQWPVEFEETAFAHQITSYANRCGLVAPWDKTLTVSAEEYVRAVETEMSLTGVAS